MRAFLRLFGRMERPAGWIMLLAGFVSFFATLFNIIVTGQAKFATLLISLDLFCSGFSAAQEAEENVRSAAKQAKRQ